MPDQSPSICKLDKLSPASFSIAAAAEFIFGSAAAKLRTARLKPDKASENCVNFDESKRFADCDNVLTAVEKADKFDTFNPDIFFCNLANVSASLPRDRSAAAASALISNCIASIVFGI